VKGNTSIMKNNLNSAGFFKVLISFFSTEKSSLVMAVAHKKDSCQKKGTVD
jgi:hypothetical protein